MLALQLAAILARALLMLGLLDLVSAQTGCRMSEEIFIVLGNLATVPPAGVSHVCCACIV